MIVNVKQKLNHSFGLPTYSTPGSAGMDLRANITDTFILKAGERTVIGTGLFIALPEGYELQVRPRSGLALKHGVTVLNTPGCVDADYRGEIGVILINHSKEDFVINPGDRIAQAIVTNVEQVEWNEVIELDETERGSGGFGSTGKL